MSRELHLESSEPVAYQHRSEFSGMAQVHFDAMAATRAQALRDRDVAQRAMREYRQAALEMHAEIRSALAWVAAGGPQNTADAMLLKAADKWRELLEDDE